MKELKEKLIKATVNTAELLSALELMEKVIERKNTIPVLALVLIECDGDGLRLTGANLDQTLHCDVSASVSCAASCAVSARLLLSIVRSIGEGEIEVEHKGNDLTISQGDLQFSIWTSSPDSFPESPKLGATPIKIAAERLRQMIGLTKFAITHEEGRYTLSGAKVIVDAEGMSMITTDGHRLAFAETKDATTKKDVDALIPRAALVLMIELSRHTEVVGLGFSSDHVFVKAGAIRMISRLLRGQFPDWKMVIPKKTSRSVTLDAKRLSISAERVMIMADDRSRALRLEFNAEHLTLTAIEDGEGRSRDVVSLTGEGDPVTTAFNGRYLGEFLKLVGGDVAMELCGPETQVLMRPANLNGLAEYFHILMPMKL